MNLSKLNEYTYEDLEKRAFLESIFPKVSLKLNKIDYNFITSEDDCMVDVYLEEPSKVCPRCGRRYQADENFCFDCLVKLNDIRLNVKDIGVENSFIRTNNSTPEGFEDILTGENMVRINEFSLTSNDLKSIMHSIKSDALNHLNDAIIKNDIDLDSLSILEKIILFVKSFVKVDFKSYGPELGFYAFNTIVVDDRQLDALQITTMLHELTHFLIKEILTQVLCRILDFTKTSEMESVATYILSYCDENRLIDEYAAHTVEGRFTLIGYQDYSSFLNIQNSMEMNDSDIEMLKTIANTLANIIKSIIESYINDDMLDDIKMQFKNDIYDVPDYSQLKHENCTLLNDEGLLKAIQYILVSGFAFSMENVEKLHEINEMW